ncbi:MAG: hypothetical protein MJ128_05340 [Mogibacterium sp.]|nr:hypothetical protein [Mogibacterium sp.]
MEMTGTCLFCGQTRMVQAETQSEADRLASENCTCDNNLKKVHQCAENIDRICGESSKEFGMDLVTEEVIDSMKDIGRHCVYGHVEAATIRLADSSVTIKQIKDGVSVSRKKVSSVKLEA